MSSSVYFMKKVLFTIGCLPVLSIVYLALDSRVSMIFDNSVAITQDKRLSLNVKRENTNNNTNRQFSNNKNVTVTMIPVITRSRSSSTFTCQHVLGTMPCHITLQELLRQKQPTTPQAMRAQEWGILGNNTSHRNQAKVVADFITTEGELECRALFQRKHKLAQTCQRHCYVNFKIGDGYFPNSVVKAILKALVPRTNHQERIVILERTDLQSEWKSLSYSLKTGDWYAGNSSQHFQDISKFNPPPMPADFGRSHRAWFQFARKAIRNLGMELDYNIPTLEWTFEHVTSLPKQELQQEAKKFLSQES